MSPCLELKTFLILSVAYLKRKKKPLGLFPNIKHVLKISFQTIFSPPPLPAKLLFLDQHFPGEEAKPRNHRQVGSWSSPPTTPLDSSASTATAASATGVQGDMGGVSWSTGRPAWCTTTPGCLKMKRNLISPRTPNKPCKLLKGKQEVIWELGRWGCPDECVSENQTISPNCAYGATGHPGNNPPKATLVFHGELKLEWQDGPAPSPLFLDVPDTYVYRVFPSVPLLSLYKHLSHLNALSPSFALPLSLCIVCWAKPYAINLKLLSVFFLGWRFSFSLLSLDFQLNIS